MSERDLLRRVGVLLYCLRSERLRPAHDAEREALLGEISRLGITTPHDPTTHQAKQP
jgi:hypothetical protein